MTGFTELKILSQIVAITGKAKITEDDLAFLPSGYKLMHIANNTECGAYKHHALAIYNENEHEIIFSNYGTHIDITQLDVTMQDLIADSQLALKSIPYKFSSTESFIYQVKDLLGEDYKDYKVTCVGHSLGGFLARLGGTLCKSIGFNDVKVVAFDSPGAKESVIKLANQLDFVGDIDSNIENYLSKPNLVNSTNQHLGKIFYIPNLEQSSAISNKGIFGYLGGMLGLNKLISGVGDHMLWNFTDFFELNEGKDSETELLQAENWEDDCIILQNCDHLEEVAALNPDYIQFNRMNNGTNPEYITCRSDIEQDWEVVRLYDHNDVTNYYAGNYDATTM